jgi:succinate dehydrogenase / fumarate reductase cytochrome b subunit
MMDVKSSTPDATIRPRPLSPNIQNYRPQLTSVLSIANRITGVVSSLGAVGFVVWLCAAAAGRRPYAIVQAALETLPGQIVLFACTFALIFHLCGGIRHLVWDTVRGFALRSIYISGWVVVLTSVVLTLSAWALSYFVGLP